MPTPLARAFAADGLVRVVGAIEREVLEAQRTAIAAAMGEGGVALDGPATWRAGGALPLVELAGALRPGPSAAARMWAVGDPALHAALASAMARATDAVFGAGVWAVQPGAQAMPNLPLEGAPWSVPHEAWHVDEPTTPGQGAPWGLLGFALIDRVEAGGGATIAVCGSHRRAARATPGPGGVITSAEAVAAIATHPAGRSLFAPPPRTVVADWCDAGVDLAVRELTGDVGDLLLMDPRLLHTVSANRSSRPRLVMRLVAARA